MQLIELLLGHLSSETYVYMGKDTLHRVVDRLSDEQIAQIIADLHTDDAIHLLEAFGEAQQKDILRHVSRKMRTLVQEGLTYPEDSAGRMMQREFVAVPQLWTVGKTLDYMHGLSDDLPVDLHDIFIVDPHFHVIGTIPLVELLRTPRKTQLKALADANIHPIPATMDQEDVALRFRRDALISAPVVNEENRLIGMITLDDIVDVISQEAEEDILKLAGVQETDIYRAVLGTARSRFSWLALNLVTAIVASLAIGIFETTLDEVVALAILMPIVASMGGNAGTQTLTVVIRALATKELSSANTNRVIGKELLVGLINGFGFAFISGVVTYVWFSDPKISILIAVAMITNLIVAGMAGILIPLGLEKAKIDPALASSVFLTTVTDIVGFVMFLGLASAVYL